MTEPIAQNQSQVLAAKRWMEDEQGMERACLSPAEYVAYRAEGVRSGRPGTGRRCLRARGRRLAGAAQRFLNWRASAASGIAFSSLPASSLDPAHRACVT